MIWPVLVVAVAGFIYLQQIHKPDFFENYAKYPALYLIIVLAVAGL